MKRLTRRGAVAGAAVVTAVSTAGIAWAWHIASGSGQTAVRAATVSDLTVTAGPDPVTGLYPGGAVNLTVNVTNNNTFPVRIVSVNRDASGTITADPAHEAGGCTTARHGVATTRTVYLATQLPAARTVPAHGQLVLTVANAVTMAPTSPDACVNATFSIPLYVVGTT